MSPTARGHAIRATVVRRVARSGASVPWVVSVGELQPGAHGLAAPLPVVGVDASVGVVGLSAIDADVVGPQVVAAAAGIAEALTKGSVR